SVKGRQPFFAMITTNAPHAPLQVRPEDEARYTGKVPDANTAKYFGMVANIDDNIGRLLDHLRETGLERDTLVIFMNDNGGSGGATPAWELFDLPADPGEKTNVSAQHADVVKQMAASYDEWWQAARAGMVNEKAVGPRLNPFKEEYWKQFGGGPTEEEAYIME